MSSAWMVVLLIQSEGRARDVLYDEHRAIEIRPFVADADHHSACVVTFPEDSIEAIVASWHEGDISIERRRENLFIKLLKKAEGDLHVVGAGGTLYRLYIRPADGEADGRVRILRPAESRRSPATALDLIRAMRRGEAPDWVSVRSAHDLLLVNERAEYECRYVYESTRYLGYVVRLTNRSSSPFRIDPSKYAAKDLILAGSREMVVEPGKETLLYLVFWR